METCTGCSAAFTQTPGRAARNNHRCAPCESSAAKARREARRAAGEKVTFAFDANRRAATAKARSAKPSVRERRAAQMRAYTADPALRQRHEARWAVRRAVAAGTLARLPCETCGAAPAQGHHDDYTKPLTVRWLCRRHHAAWHRTNAPVYAAATTPKGKKA